jgi:DNA-binding NtrC family response regulator
VEAQTADEAMLILKEDRSIAAVFSDVQMPGRMDGTQWLARKCPKIKVLLTSGRMAPNAPTDWQFLAKPYKLEEMERVLRHQIRQSGAPVIIDHVAQDRAFCRHPTPAMYGFQSYISMLSYARMAPSSVRYAPSTHDRPC